jgi:hypothetical protein
VFNFINNLSPIPPPKPLDSAHNVQLFKSSDLAPVSSIFASPHVNPTKGTKVLIRFIFIFSLCFLANLDFYVSVLALPYSLYFMLVGTNLFSFLMNCTHLAVSELG